MIELSNMKTLLKILLLPVYILYIFFARTIIGAAIFICWFVIPFPVIVLILIFGMDFMTQTGPDAEGVGQGFGILCIILLTFNFMGMIMFKEWLEDQLYSVYGYKYMFFKWIKVF